MNTLQGVDLIWLVMGGIIEFQVDFRQRGGSTQAVVKRRGTKDAEGGGENVECVAALGVGLPTPPIWRVPIVSRQFLFHESHQLFAIEFAPLLKLWSCFSICSSPTIGARQVVPLQ